MKETNEQRIERLKQIVLAMPEKPGSYQYYDATGTIIYVGKAKNLKRRVSSYFHKEVDRFKTKVLVSKIQHITYTVVNTEEDALLLENALIKKYNPRYNVLLKDGKTYPSICITNEPFPRIFKTRTFTKKGDAKVGMEGKRYGTYYGPYSHLGSMYTVLELIKKLYHPRTCRLPLTKESIATGKYKPCLDYHIKNCGGACIGKQSYEEYQAMIAQAREILKGNTRALSEHVYAEMMKAAEELRFEDAEELKKQYMLIDQFCAKSEVVSHTITDVDVFTTDHPLSVDNIDGTDETVTFINYMHVTNGTITQSFTYEYKDSNAASYDTDEEKLTAFKELFLSAIVEIRERFHSTAKEIIVPFGIDWKIQGAEFFVPQRGDKHHLVELSLMNCRQYRVDRLKQSEKLNPEQKYTRLMKELQERIKLPKLPYHIELFDNSNISGTDAVAGCVVYKGMKPSKKDYTKYNIKTVEGPDDYASMREVVLRRYDPLTPQGGTHNTTEGADNRDVTSSQIHTKTPPTGDRGLELPDLIICDGGIGQMNSVAEVVWGELALTQISIAGLAKNDKHRTQELLVLDSETGECLTAQLDPKSELFHTLTQMQDEVHRYAITFHRDKRSKRALHSELDDIKGIGPKAKETLLKTFKSVKKIREATLEELTDAIGQAKANIIYNHFKN